MSKVNSPASRVSVVWRFGIAALLVGFAACGGDGGGGTGGRGGGAQAGAGGSGPAGAGEIGRASCRERV